ncbi:MAG: thymidylate synthase [Myxococcales bacterium]|nr:thymidylate synthase [Myxococcales bacterium]
MRAYLDLLRRVLDEGTRRDDRTGTGTLSLFGAQLRFDLRAGFPLVTTKKVHWRSVVAELLWFIRGETNVRWLQARGCGSGIRGRTLRVSSGRSTARSGARGARGTGARSTSCGRDRGDRPEPHSRRLVVSAWNVGELDRMALPPCHALFQFHVAEGRLSCQLYQRSADLFIGCRSTSRRMRS